MQMPSHQGNHETIVISSKRERLTDELGGIEREAEGIRRLLAGANEGKDRSVDMGLTSSPSVLSSILFLISRSRSALIKHILSSRSRHPGCKEIPFSSIFSGCLFCPLPMQKRTDLRYWIHGVRDREGGEAALIKRRES